MLTLRLIGGKTLTFNHLRYNYLQGQLCATVRMAALVAFMSIATALHASEPKDTTKVFICTGPTAYAYHTNPNCDGLTNCAGEVKQVTAKEARKQGRTYCGYCRKTTLPLRKDKKITKSNQIM